MKRLRGHHCAVPVLLVFLAALGTVCPGDAQGSGKSAWSFLSNSYWIVPPANLPALLSDTSNGGTFVPIVDQTVFHIQTYQGGYFWGQVATMLTIGGEASGPNCYQLVGSITPEGSVQLSFTPTGSTGVATTGLGTMRFIRNQWTMENQMSTGVNSGLVTHWAYMAQCHANQPCQQQLPGTSLTVAQMLAPCS
jgi:hypothetical protein